MGTPCTLPRGQRVDHDDPTEAEQAQLKRALEALRSGSYVRNLLRPESLQLVPGRGFDRSLPTIMVSRINMGMLGDRDPTVFCIAMMEVPAASREEVALITDALHCIIAIAAVETQESDVRSLSAHCAAGATRGQVRRRMPAPDGEMREVDTDPRLFERMPPFGRIGVIVPDEDAESPEAVSTIVISPLTTSILKDGALPDAIETLRVMSALKSLAFDGSSSTIDGT